MWVPQSWVDLELAIGVQVESASLDFKSALPPKGKIRDLAKDAAAMSIDGGVVLVGLAEEDGVATAITPIELKGAMERVQQVIDANVSPALPVEVTPLREKDGDDKGVLVISVPASWSAPHEYESRFPARAGATTRYLGEREIEALYARRWELRQQGDLQAGIQGHQLPPGVRIEIGDHAVGLMRLHVRPPGNSRLPLEPHIGPALREATAEAAASVEGFMRPEFHPKSVDLLQRWEPAGTLGWRAGRFLQGGLPLSVMVGAMYRYGAGFSLTVTIDLAEGLEPDAGDGARCAHEHHWAIEVMTLLSVAGHFFKSFPETGLLRVDLELGGLLEAVSWQASGGLAFGSGAPQVTENLYLNGGMFATRDLAQDPRDATRALLDPFMVAILSEGSDVVAWVETGQY
jgi:hypothetical protein